MKKELNLPSVLTIALISYGIVAGFNIGLSIACFAICGLHGFQLWLNENKKVTQTQEVIDRLNRVETQLGLIKLNTGLRNSNEQKKF